MDDMKKALSEDAVFELLSYLVTSAQVLLHEPAVYGSLRLIDAAGRLARLAMDDAPDDSRAFLRELHQDIDEGKTLVMSNPEAFAALLDDLVRATTRQLKSRSAGSP